MADQLWFMTRIREEEEVFWFTLSKDRNVPRWSLCPCTAFCRLNEQHPKCWSRSSAAAPLPNVPQCSLYCFIAVWRLTSQVKAKYAKIPKLCLAVILPHTVWFAYSLIYLSKNHIFPIHGPGSCVCCALNCRFSGFVCNQNISHEADLNVATCRVTTCLENLEMSGNLKAVREM